MTVCICGCGSCSGSHPSLLPLPCCPPPSAFRGTWTVSSQSRGALTADSWPAGVMTTPSVCGTPPAGRARPHWRWAGAREGPPGRGVTQPPVARPACMNTGHCVCAVLCVCTHIHVSVCGCMCVWRVGWWCACMRVRRQGVQRMCMCVYGVPLVPRVVCTPFTTCVTVCDCVCMWLWLV